MLIDDVVVQLDPVRIKPLIEAVQRSARMQGRYDIPEPRGLQLGNKDGDDSVREPSVLSFSQTLGWSRAKARPAGDALLRAVGAGRLVHSGVTTDTGVRQWQVTATRIAPSCSRSARTSSIFVTKGIAAFITGSGAMLAETVHSLADCGNQLLLLLGLRQARTPPSPDYPLGYGKAIYFWSFLVAVILFSVGGMFSLYEGVHKLQHPEPLKQWWWAVGVLVISIAAEAVSMRACLVEVNKARGSRSLARWFRESRQAELIVIFGEDLAALLGLIFALVAIVAAVVTGNPMWDAIGTLAIGVLLIVVAVFVAIEVKAMLIGQSADPEVSTAIKAFFEERAEIARVFSLITLQLGNDLMVAVKVQLQRSATFSVEETINTVEREFKRRFPQVKWSFVEPDIAD